MSKMLLVLLVVVVVFPGPSSPGSFISPIGPSFLHRDGVNGVALLSSRGYNDDERNGRNETTGESSGDGETRTISIAGSTVRPRRRGLLFRITGDSSPYDFPTRAVPLTKVWPSENPFPTSDAWGRMDASNDRLFYLVPRITYHIDEAAVCALTRHHQRTLLPRHEGGDVLDLCSSWVSHYPVDFTDRTRSIRGLGLNPIELALNDQLTGGYDVFDLNSGGRGSPQPSFPYEDQSFDAVTCSCSFDYLVRPVEVLAECRRVLRPGGTIVLGFSNRCFATKATKVWRVTSNQNHVQLINGYFQYATGFGTREAYDITAVDGENLTGGWLSSLPSFGTRDPIFVVQARRLD